MAITPQEALARVIVHREIFFDEMVDLMRQVMRGDVSPVMTAAILTGLRVKKETIEEIAGAATVMREFAARVELPDSDALVDIVGTGGDGAHTFNISTAAMFVVAAAGGKVAKHGNRSVSSKSGSADVLEALGAAIELAPAQVAACIAETGLGFMYAPMHHPAMRNVGPVRKELGVRTIFNILGPLTNPACAPNILMGVFHPDLVGIQARVLRRLGARRALVVHGRDGLDELTLSGPTLVAELRDDRIFEYEVEPREFGLPTADLATIRVESPAQSRDMLLGVLDGTAGPARDIVLLNAGAALVAAGVAASIGDGVARARAALDGGEARARLDAYVAATRRLAADPLPLAPC
jgi:anthranilate phosphoribosyltransferase